MQTNHTSRTSAIAPAAMALTRWEQAEAEAEADLIDADLESCGSLHVAAVTVAPRRILPRTIAITECELAEAECETDLCHVDDAA